MRNILLTLRFQGTNYHGWQVQKNALTIQECLQDAMELIFHNRDGVVGCSRTDAGVHANMYCCNIKTHSTMATHQIIRALNANLPDDIAVTDCVEVPLEFHARYSCISKQYQYKIWNSCVKNPFETTTALHYKYPLDAQMLDKECKDFIGKYDYSAFCASGSSVSDTVREVFDASVERQGDFVIFKVEADGFLYNMVRIMVGTLLYISQEKIPQGAIPSIISSGKREQAGITAPACGLYLNKVNYGGVKVAKDETKTSGNITK